ncbi:MAG: hypothetical protein D6768_07000 [Chloroflexi bacterium]|nr:MAG: hypothetical protein D6768_07000 [Chloroflexota bacterium]
MGGVAFVFAQHRFIGQIHLDDPLADFCPETGRLNAVNHHRQITVPGGFDENPVIAVLNFVKLALFILTKRLARKITDGGQHPADQIGVFSFFRMAAGVPEQQPGFTVNQKHLGYREGQRITQNYFSAGNAAHAGANQSPRIERGSHPNIETAR